MDSTSPCSSFINDYVLFEAIRNGNISESNNAVKCLYSYKDVFFGYIIKELTNRNMKFNKIEKMKDLEDAYQDAMLNFIKKIKADPPEFEVLGTGTIKSFMIGMALNKYKDIIRKRAIFLKHKGRYKEGQYNDYIVNLFEEVLKKERRNSIQKAIKELEADCPELLDQRYNQGLKLEDIRHLQTESAGANNISKKILKCRKKLKSILMSKYGFPDSFL